MPSLYLGGLTLFLFCVQVVTGVLLLFYYQATPEAAHQSLETLVTKVPEQS